MSIASTHTIQPHVLEGSVVRVEADISRGLNAFTIVGLAGKAIEEAKDRINAAITHSGYTSPRSSRNHLTISLAPADIKKEGPLFDLPIAIAYLSANNSITPDSSKRLYVGELALDGSLRPIRGVLTIVKSAVDEGFAEVVVPTANAKEAGLVDGIDIYPAQNLQEVIRHIDSNHPDPEKIPKQPLTTLTENKEQNGVLLEDIKGQTQAKRALAIAAAGKHNVLLVGPPGTGKTMLARALAGILPPLTREEALAVTAIHSVAGALTESLSSVPPFRAPHHSASHTALVGGGSIPKPGEVTLAHHGVLFMDEFAEFERRSLDALRQPLEDKQVSIARVQNTAEFPANFLLVAALNPYRGNEDGTNDYMQAIKNSYGNKISGPILDRIDLWVEMPHVDYKTLQNTNESGETEKTRQAINIAREQMQKRNPNNKPTVNAELSSRDIDETIQLSAEVQDLLHTSSQKLNLSPRSYHRLIKVARTIADLDNAENIESKHLLESLQFRTKL